MRETTLCARAGGMRERRRRVRRSVRIVMMGKRDRPRALWRAQGDGSCYAMSYGLLSVDIGELSVILDEPASWLDIVAHED